MRPIKRTKFIEIEYWDCGNKEHNHKTEKVALDCMEKQVNKKPANKPKHARNIQIAKDLLRGKRQCDIAKEYGITATTIRRSAQKVFRTGKWIRYHRGVKDSPCSDYDLKEVCSHSGYWFSVVDEVAEYWNV